MSTQTIVTADGGEYEVYHCQHLNTSTYVRTCCLDGDMTLYCTYQSCSDHAIDPCKRRRTASSYPDTIQDEAQCKSNCCGDQQRSLRIVVGSGELRQIRRHVVLVSVLELYIGSMGIQN